MAVNAKTAEKIPKYFFIILSCFISVLRQIYEVYRFFTEIAFLSGADEGTVENVIIRSQFETGVAFFFRNTSSGFSSIFT